MPSIPSIDLPPAVWATAGLATVLFLHSKLSGRSSLPLPPGPRKLPIVGSLFSLPSGFEWKTYKEWSRQYNSDIIHFDVVGTSMIVLTSYEAVDDLLEKRSSVYSDRAIFPMLIELMEWTFNVATMPYGERWRAGRRLFNQSLNVISAKNFRPKQTAATHKLLRRLLHTPVAFKEHLKQMSGEIIMSVAYGIEVLPENDPWINLNEEAVHAGAQAAIFGRFLVDQIPILKYVPEWFPGAGFKRIAKEWKKLGRRLEDEPFNEVKRQMAAGTAPHSFTAESLQILAESDDKYYQEDTVSTVAASMYAAGADTTATALSTFLLAMLANPEAQKKAQMEIDRVIGKGQLPTFNDEESLPYVSALIKEILRWQPVTPIAVPHYIPVEDEYRGYRLPAGSIVIGNTWALLQDETVYPDPTAFKPERFLRSDGTLDPDVRDPYSVFGYGRRICPGRHLALSSVWIAVVSILAGFEVTKAVGEDGKLIEPTFEYSSFLISAPLPFECTIKPRSAEAAALIESTANADDHA
ncbi:cytochrome P450 [Mycena epipterygia]|nr:cytochrome P450 [Mycena epipterygia]